VQSFISNNPTISPVSSSVLFNLIVSPALAANRKANKALASPESTAAGRERIKIQRSFNQTFSLRQYRNKDADCIPDSRGDNLLRAGHPVITMALQHDMKSTHHCP